MGPPAPDTAAPVPANRNRRGRGPRGGRRGRAGLGDGDASSYEELWGTELSLALGGEGLELSLREWVSSGLMTLFFVSVWRRGGEEPLVDLAYDVDPERAPDRGGLQGAAPVLVS
jgi:hypothetical protein